MVNKDYGNTKNGGYKRLFAVVIIVVIISVISVFLSHSVFPCVQIKGASLEPQWHSGDILLLLDKNEYQTGELCSISVGNKILIRRVIGHGGDRVVITSGGDIYLNGDLLDEPYLSEKHRGEKDLSFEVPQGSVFVLNDNRGLGYDSTDPGIGYIDEDLILGKVLFKVWPLV